jgi:hypothetical protein
MDMLEAKVRLLELAAVINKPTGNHDATDVVKTATVLYTFLEASPVDEELPVADKPKRGRPPKSADILS